MLTVDTYTRLRTFRFLRVLFLRSMQMYDVDPFQRWELPLVSLLLLHHEYFVCCTRRSAHVFAYTLRCAPVHQMSWHMCESSSRPMWKSVNLCEWFPWGMRPAQLPRLIVQIISRYYQEENNDNGNYYFSFFFLCSIFRSRERNPVEEDKLLKE